MSGETPVLAVVVTTYNRPDALARVLQAYLAQDDRAIEMLIADDGSGDATRQTVERFARSAPFPVRHIWHPDAGFRAGTIRNRAIASTRADYLVFTDGDCIPLPGFVARHRALAQSGWFVAGNRMLLSERFTARVLQDTIELERWPAWRWAWHWLARDVNRIAPLFARADGPWRLRTPQRWEGAKTCNLAVWREDLERVNGFDESYGGWGLEDSDLVIRLLHAGVRHKNGRFATPLAHLWHAENDRSGLAHNRQRLDALIASRAVRAPTGLAENARAASAGGTIGATTPGDVPAAALKQTAVAAASAAAPPDSATAPR